MINGIIDISLGPSSFKLQEKHNFDWLFEIGNPFVVFDKQDSGNLCFGIERNCHKLFVKYAGAKTIEFRGSTVDAIYRLKSAIQAYIDLSHEALIVYKYSFETPPRFCCCF